MIADGVPFAELREAQEQWKSRNMILSPNEPITAVDYSAGFARLQAKR